MYCKICPVQRQIDALQLTIDGALRHAERSADDDNEVAYTAKCVKTIAPMTMSELREACIACHCKAVKYGNHRDDDGRMHGEIALVEATYSDKNDELKEMDFATDEFSTEGAEGSDDDNDDGDAIDQLEREPTSISSKTKATTCTLELSEEVEDVMRRVCGIVIDGVRVKYATILLGILKGEKLKRDERYHTRREFADGVRMCRDALLYANTEIDTSEAPAEAHKAAGKLVRSLASMLTDLDAPIVLGILKQMSIAAIARAAGLNSRATAHNRLKMLLERVPRFMSLHNTAAK